MGIWEEAPEDSVSFRYLYYCMVCEEFFPLSPIAPTRCPMCFCDARYILGPRPTKEYDLDNMIRKQKQKYRDAMKR